jgi:putative membrane protein
MLQLTDADREKVSAAIAAAEANSNGEIVAVATPISDA